MLNSALPFGYEGIDLTVRAGGHVLPERVQDDLPKAAETIRKAGLKFSMITSDIIDVKTPHAENVLKTLKSLGVKDYRWGGFKYDLKRSIPEQLAEFKARVKDLAAMNKQYGVCAMYHTHSGVGSGWRIDVGPVSVGEGLRYERGFGELRYRSRNSGRWLRRLDPQFATCCCPT